MTIKNVPLIEEELRQIEKAHQNRLQGLRRAFDHAQRELQKELNSFSSFEIMTTKNNHGERIYYRKYKDGRLSTPFKSKEGCLRWYLDGGR